MSMQSENQGIPEKLEQNPQAGSHRVQHDSRPSFADTELDSMHDDTIASPSIEWSQSPSPIRCDIIPNSPGNNELIGTRPPSNPLAEPGVTAPGISTTKLQGVSARQIALFEQVISELKKDELTFAGWLAFIFEPRRESEIPTEIKYLRTKYFWHDEGKVRELLENWTHSQQAKSGRLFFEEWMIGHVAALMRNEAVEVTEKKVLRSADKPIGPAFLREFRIKEIKEKLQRYCPTSVKLMLSMAGVDSSHATLNNAPMSAQNIVLYCLIAILREFSQQNNLVQLIFSLYMYAAGLQRQAFGVLAHVGLLVSYSLFVSGLGTRTSSRRQSRTTEPDSISKKDPTPGTLKKLSSECIKEIKKLVAEGKPVGFVFDNINLILKIAEVVLGRSDAPVNGTCATAFEVFQPTDEGLDQHKAHTAYLAAPPLTQEDILFSADERVLHRKMMIYSILRIIISHGGPQFVHYRSLLDKCQPVSNHVIELHRSKTYPLAAMEINEASIEGTIDVMNAIYEQVGVDTASEAFKNQVILVAGDHKSIANLRAGQESRVGNDNPEHSFGNVTFIIGLFHTLMAAATGFLTLHYGKSTAGILNPGSLHFHNKILERNPITIGSPIPYTISRNLIEVSLIARVLHCLTLVSGCRTLDEYADLLIALDESSCMAETASDNPGSESEESASWDRLVSDATRIYERYASIRVVDELRTARKFAEPGEKAGDMVYENALLFMRDMLNLQELKSAVKRGDSGRVFLVLKLYALSFRGAGRTQYAHEFLHMIHHVQKIWPTALRDLVFRNWMLNTTGHPDAWIGLDLHQEHGNLWIKTIYKAHGSNASWSWLAAISPCIEVLRSLARDLNSVLGTYVGVKHTVPDLTMDISKLMQSIEEHGIYRLRPGRTFDGEDEPVLDAESVGKNSLFDGKPSALFEYNKIFKASQMSRRQPVVSEMVSHESLPRYPPAGSSSHQSASQGATRRMPVTELGSASRATNETSLATETQGSDAGSEEELGGPAGDEDNGFETQEAVVDIELEDEDLARMFFGENIDGEVD